MSAPREGALHRELKALKGEVARMAEAARLQVREAVESLERRDGALARRVMDRDREVDRLDVEIEARAIDLIARHQPMAGDLRTLGTILKLITYLDRIARYGYDIAQVTLEMGDRPHIAKLVTIPHAARICDEMVEQATTAFMSHDAELAQGVFPRDEEVDALYDQVFRECLTYMMEDSRLITQCAHYILVIRHLERVADNACKVAEKVVYMVTGRRRLPGEYPPLRGPGTPPPRVRSEGLPQGEGGKGPAPGAEGAGGS